MSAKNNKQRSSKFAGVLKTTLFLFGIVGILVVLAFFLSNSGSSGSTPENLGYETIDINILADFYYDESGASSGKAQPSPASEIFPEKVLNLNGRKIALTGFIMPVKIDDQGYVEEFALNGNYDMCFFGAPSRMNQWVHVKMLGGAKAKFSHSPITVMGTLEVGERVENGFVVSLYRLNGDKATTRSNRYF